MVRLAKFFLALLVFVLLLATAVVFLRPNKIVSRAEAVEKLRTPNSRFIDWQGARLHYIDEGQGFPVMMIHGFGGSFKNFDTLAWLMKNDYRVIRVDLPGFGLSTYPPVNGNENYIQRYRDYMTFLLDTLHLDSLYIIGNSMGGGMCWLMAGDHPEKVKKVVLLAAAGYNTKEAAAKLAMFRFSSIGKVFDSGMPLFMSRKGLLKGYMADTKVTEELITATNYVTNIEGNIAHMLNLARARQFPDEALIKRVKSPTLIIWGQQDEIVPVGDARRFEKDIPGSRVHIFDTCGHMPMMELPYETHRVVMEFFRQ